jgi:hypothetical protein
MLRRLILQHQHMPRDDQPLDLTGPFADGHQARVAVDALTKRGCRGRSRFASQRSLEGVESGFSRSGTLKLLGA